MSIVSVKSHIFKLYALQLFYWIFEIPRACQRLLILVITPKTKNIKASMPLIAITEFRLFTNRFTFDSKVPGTALITFLFYFWAQKIIICTTLRFLQHRYFIYFCCTGEMVESRYEIGTSADLPICLLQCVSCKYF